MKIFINYRRDDSAGYAGRLFDHLSAYFDARNIFMDIDTIKPGDDFRKVLETAVGACDVVLVMIGRQWLTVADPHGGRRLDNPQDWVRIEIASALANPRLRVIPVLVRGASVPDADELPEDIRAIAWRNAFELSDTRFQYDANRLIRMIEQAAGKPKAMSGFKRFRRNMGRVLGIALAVTVLALLGLAAKYFLDSQQQLQYSVSNQLAQSVHVYGNDEFEGTVAPGETKTFTRFSRSDFPLSVRWEIKKIGSYGDDMSETIRRVDELQTIIVDNQIGQTTYFHPVISSTLDQQCRISVNDGTQIEAPAGFINANSRNVTPGYFLWRNDSNVTLYCGGEPMWFGIRNANDRSRFWALPRAGDGKLEMTFFAPDAAP
jgi:hypothetical protein